MEEWELRRKGVELYSGEGGGEEGVIFLVSYVLFGKLCFTSQVTIVSFTLKVKISPDM